MSLRSKFLDIIQPFLEFFGKIHSPFSKKKIKQRHAEDIIGICEPGDIVLSRTRGEFSNILIPGFFKHAGIVYKTENDCVYIIESVNPKVRMVGIYDFCMTKDYICLLRPKLSEVDRLLAANISLSFIGRDYDYRLSIPHVSKKNHSFYCAELPYWAYKKIIPRWGPSLKKILGEDTISPQDYVRYSEYYTLIYGEYGYEITVKKNEA